MSSSGCGTVINFVSGSDFITSYSSGSTRQKVTQVRFLWFWFRLEEILNTSHKKLNEHKINRKFEKYDYVFVLDRRITPGATRPLKTKLQPSPYIVIKPLHVTSLVKRISDGFTTLYSNNDLKKFEGEDPNFLRTCRRRFYEY
jgi:hypothetical protein